MPALSIITINFNNAIGLNRTMASVLSQNSIDFEYIVIDGGSNDGSVNLIQQVNTHHLSNFAWISESDRGIYHAMNKGIQLSKGKYCQFLNSGDVLVDADVTRKMIESLDDGDLVYGNMLKSLLSGTILIDRSFQGAPISILDLYIGTLNHSSCYIKRSLFDTYGKYDEELKIVSDWKWFFKVIGLNGIVPIYKNINISLFDMTGISNTNGSLESEERREVLKTLLPDTILSDYDQYSASIIQIKLLNKYWITKYLCWIMERVIFRFDKLLYNH